MSEKKRRRSKVTVNDDQSLPEHPSPADMAALYGGGGTKAEEATRSREESAIAVSPALDEDSRVVVSHESELKSSRVKSKRTSKRSARVQATGDAEHVTKNFSSLSSAVVEALQGFPEAWRQSRYRGQKRPSTRWVIETILLRFFEGSDAEILSRVGEAWVKKFENEAHAESGREDFSVRISSNVAARLQHVSNLWNDESVVPTRPYLSFSWFFEAAVQAFTGECDLVDQVSAAWLDSVRQTFASGVSRN